MSREEPETVEDILGPPVDVDDDETSFWGANPELYDRWQQWNAQQKLAGGPTLGSLQAQSAFGYMEPFELDDFGQALDLYTRYLYQPELGVPGPSGAQDYVTERGEEALEQARAWTAGTMRPGEAQPSLEPPRALTAEQQKYWDKAIQTAQEKGLPDPAAFARLLLWESNLDPEAGPSSAGAYGIGQFMPGTAEAYGIDPADPEASIEAAAQYLLDNYNSLQARFGSANWRQAYAAYFYGAGGIGDIIEAEGENWEAAMDPAYAGELQFAMGDGAGAAPGAGGFPPGPYPGQEAPLRTLTDAEYTEWVQLNSIYGVTKQEYILAKSLGDDPVDVHAALQLAARIEELRGIAPDWSDEDLAIAASLHLTDEDVTAAVTGGQKPKQWWDERMGEVEGVLKGRGLEWADLEEMTREGIGFNEYEIMQELGMSAVQWHTAMQVFGNDPQAIWEAAQMGYSPATMTPAQLAQFTLRSDVTVQAMRLMSQLPEGIRSQISLATIQQRYEIAQVEARARGEYVSPQDFLQGEFRGLFGGGTGSELRSDLDRLTGGFEMWEPGMSPAEQAAAAQGGYAGPQRGQRRGTRVGAGGGVQRRIFPGSGFADITHGMTEGGEMVLWRQMAGAFLGAGGKPVGTQTAAEAAERQAAVAARYPKLAARYKAGEFETPEQKRRRKLLEGLQTAHSG